MNLNDEIKHEQKQEYNSRKSQGESLFKTQTTPMILTSYLLDKPRCCQGEKPSGGAVLVIANGWNIEMYGSHSLDSYEKIKTGRAPTRIQFAGEMVNVPDNPGKVMRNR